MDDMRVDFLFTLYFIGRKVKGHYKKENTDLMLAAAILHILQKRDVTLSELAKILYSKLSSLSEKIAEMEKEGVIQKLNSEGDEREQLIHLTAQGKKKIEKTLEVMKLHCVEFTKEVSNEELKIITPVLKKLTS